MVSDKLDIELSGDARRVIADARGFDDPKPEDRERVKARWLASIAAGAGVSSLSDTARAGTGASWATKGATLAIAMAAGVAGLYLALPGAEAPSHRAVPLAPVPLPDVPDAPASRAAEEETDVAKSTEPVVPSPSAVPALAEAVALAPEPTRVVSSAPRRALEAKRVSTTARATKATAPAREEAVPTAASGQLSEEIALLSLVRGSVREGAGARAIERLSEYRQRFERPILGMEAAALGVDALCQTGQRDAARAAASKFRNNWPGSPLEQRVSTSCPEL